MTEYPSVTFFKWFLYPISYHQVSNLKKILKSMLEYYHDVRRFSQFYSFFFHFFCVFKLGWGSVPTSGLSLHEQVLGHQVSDEHLPDVNLIGEMGDVTELGKLVQLVLGCAVSCEKKQGKAECFLFHHKSNEHRVLKNTKRSGAGLVFRTVFVLICIWLHRHCFCALFSKTEQIQQIMTLEESVQHVVMTAIQEVSEWQ